MECAKASNDSPTRVGVSTRCNRPHWPDPLSFDTTSWVYHDNGLLVLVSQMYATKTQSMWSIKHVPTQTNAHAQPGV